MSNHQMHVKKHKKIGAASGLTAAGTTLLLAAVNGHAQSLDNLYATIDAGASLQQNVSILDGTGFSGSGGDIKFQTGWRVGADVGYRFCDYLSAEFVSGLIWNNITTIGHQDLAGVASAHLEEVPLLANGVFTYPLGNFKPYVGLGLGAVVGIFHGSDFQNLGGPPNYNDTDVTFAYQAEIGMNYSVCKNVEVGLAYRFVGTSNHQWDNESILIKTDGTMIHTIEATFTWRF